MPDDQDDITLDDLEPGSSGIIRKVLADNAIRQRLMDLGIIEGIEVELVRSAPLGDPLEIKVFNSLLALRRAEARTLIIDPVGECHHGPRRRRRHRTGRKSKQR